MNKKIKRTVAMALVVSALATVQPAKYNNVNFLMTEASAASVVYLDKLSVSGHGNVSLKDSKNKTYSVNVPRGNENATITITTDSSSDIVEFDGDVLEPESSSSKKYRVKVDLDNKGSSANSFTIKVTDKDGEKENTYKLKVYRKSTSSSKDDDDDDDKYDDVYLDDIVLSDGKIDFSKKKKSFDIEVAESVDEIKIKAKPDDDDYRVYIDEQEVEEDDKWRTTVDLSKGKNVIKIEVEDEDNDEKRVYTLNIYRGTKAPSSGTESSKVDSTQDSIYLEDVVLNSGELDINFNKKVTSYETSVSESTDSVTLKVTSEDEDDKIYLNGDKISSGSKKRVQLDKGENKITLEVNNSQDYDKDDDDYEQRIYTIKIFRGVNSSTVVKPSEPTVTPNQMNQWVNVMGKWKYFDSTGKPLSNQWLYDRNYANYFFLDSDGFMTTGWLSNGGKWYYLNQSGAMLTGWLPSGDNWYYLDSNGAMVTGWFKDYSVGKWYYFDASGKMLKNTKVGNYKLGPSGAMI